MDSLGCQYKMLNTNRVVSFHSPVLIQYRNECCVWVCVGSQCMVCVQVDPKCVIGRGCRPGSAMSLGSVKLEEVLAVLWDSSRRCAQHGMAAVFSFTDKELDCLHSQ